MAGRSPHFSRPSAIAAAMAGYPIALRPNLRDAATRQLIGKPLTGHFARITNVIFGRIEGGIRVALGHVNRNIILGDVAKERPLNPSDASLPPCGGSAYSSRGIGLQEAMQ